MESDKDLEFFGEGIKEFDDVCISGLVSRQPELLANLSWDLKCDGPLVLAGSPNWLLWEIRSSTL